MAPFSQLVRGMNSTMMSEFDAWERILSYVVGDRLKANLEDKVQHMVVEANKVEIFDVRQRINIELKPLDKLRSTGMENGDA